MTPEAFSIRVVVRPRKPNRLFIIRGGDGRAIFEHGGCMVDQAKEEVGEAGDVEDNTWILRNGKKGPVRGFMNHSSD